MKTQFIGKTNTRVTELSFSCAGLGNPRRKVAQSEAEAILQRAWQAGIRYFDTAPFYGRGLSEMRLRPFLASMPRDSFSVSTKVGRLLSPGPALDEADGFIAPLPNSLKFDYSGDGIEASFEQSCERLGLNRIDIVYIHDIGQMTHGLRMNNLHMLDLMMTGMDRLRRLKEAGRIGAIGLAASEVRVCLDLMRDVHLDAILLAGRLTLLDRSADQKLAALCIRRSTSLVISSVFNSGILAQGAVPEATYDHGPVPEAVLQKVQALEANASKAGKTLAFAALEFALRHNAPTSVMLGATRLSSLEQNLQNVSRILAQPVY